MPLDQVVLEYATDRAGDVMRFEAPELGLGVVNPRTERIETVEEIREAIDRALAFYPPEAIFVNPDCGFATFSNRPVNVDEVAMNKIRAMRAAVDSYA